MVEIANEPAVVLVCVVLAAALVVGEVALPTLGLAGFTGVGLVIVATIGIADADLEWWPLSLASIAVAVWCIMIARRATSVLQQAVAIALFTAGTVYFGVIESDAITIVLALVGSAGLAVGFPALFERAARLFDSPSVIGMEAFVGRTAAVTEWDGDRGKVLVEGSFWNAEGPAGLNGDDEVVITGHEGMTLSVRRPAPDPGRMPMTVPQKDAG